jgi:hypothetical protein
MAVAIMAHSLKETTVNLSFKCPTTNPQAKSTWILVLASLLPNCGSSGDSADQACAVLAKAQCQRRQACTNTALAIYSDGVFVLNTYGDMTTCLERQQQACIDNATAPGTGTSPAQLEKCASEYPSWSCTDLFDGNANPPPDCAPAGKLANGQTCALAGQCASRFCSETKNASCGVCADEPIDGASCLTSGCAPGQACKIESAQSASVPLCRDRLAIGDTTCTTDIPCQAFSTCVGASADVTKTGACTATALSLDAACGGTGPACEGNLGLACLGAVGAKTCQQVAYVRAPAACGTLPDNSRAECISADCFTAMGPAAVTDTNATCVAQAADGAACDTQIGPLCLAPARCVTGVGATAGTCVVPIATLCK